MFQAKSDYTRQVKNRIVDSFYHKKVIFELFFTREIMVFKRRDIRWMYTRLLQ